MINGSWLLPGLKAGQAESAKFDWKTISKEKVAALSQLFTEVGTKAGRASGLSVGKLVIAKVQVHIFGHFWTFNYFLAFGIFGPLAH